VAAKRPGEGEIVGEKRSIINDVPERLRGFAKEQRSTMPHTEALFWERVRAGRLNGLKFKRQVPITPYIVDFLCIAAKVVIELDGLSHELPEQKAHDARRDAWLRSQGFVVLRFPNEAVIENCGAVLDMVLATIDARLSPSPGSLPGRPGREPPSPAKGERVIGASSSRVE
jgi:very-short-patch-repair endonuclease